MQQFSPAPGATRVPLRGFTFSRQETAIVNCLWRRQVNTPLRSMLPPEFMRSLEELSASLETYDRSLSEEDKKRALYAGVVTGCQALKRLDTQEFQRRLDEALKETLRDRDRLEEAYNLLANRYPDFLRQEQQALEGCGVPESSRSRILRLLTELSGLPDLDFRECVPGGSRWVRYGGGSLYINQLAGEVCGAAGQMQEEEDELRALTGVIKVFSGTTIIVNATCSIAFPALAPTIGPASVAAGSLLLTEAQTVARRFMQGYGRPQALA